MNLYQVWCDLKDTSRDLQFADAVAKLMAALEADGSIESWRLVRRKLGFGPRELGEFRIEMQVADLAALDRAFGAIAPRTGETEVLHARVFSMVTNFRSALERDFPDPVRVRPVTPQG